MLVENVILSALDLNSDSFRWTNVVKVYDNKSHEPYGEVKYRDGKYILTVFPKNKTHRNYDR